MHLRAKAISLTSIILALTALRFVSAGAPGGGPDPAAVAGAAPPVVRQTPPTKITSALADVPPDAVGESSQFSTDLNAWLTFIALNWPADTGTCGPNKSATILGGAGPTVWETYLTDADVFVAPGSQPSPWCPQTNGTLTAAQLSRLPAAVRRQAQQAGARKIFFRLSKASADVKRKARAGAGPHKFTSIEQSVGGPLTDQNGRFVRYEVRLNKDEYDFLKQYSLWNRKGQDAYTRKNTIAFPKGDNATGVVGAIEIKAAWKVLTPAEVAGKRFYMTTGVVYNNEQKQRPSIVTLGLVGLHFAHKTVTQPNWIWATFEHVDNLTPPPGSPPGAKASFFNPDCPPATCPPNAQTAKPPYTELGPTGRPLNRPVQVVRLNPVETLPVQPDNNVDQLNQIFQQLLQGSVWGNYQLISAQWEGEIPPGPKPPYLANSVIETFIQGPVPPSDGPNPYPSPKYNPFASGVTSSCLKCHSVAVTASALANNQPQPKADFSFIMGNAQ